jgi:hypothetical protein
VAVSVYCVLCVCRSPAVSWLPHPCRQGAPGSTPWLPLDPFGAHMEPEPSGQQMLEPAEDEDAPAAAAAGGGAWSVPLTFPHYTNFVSAPFSDA